MAIQNQERAVECVEINHKRIGLNCTRQSTTDIFLYVILVQSPLGGRWQFGNLEISEISHPRMSVNSTSVPDDNEPIAPEPNNEQLVLRKKGEVSSDFVVLGYGSGLYRVRSIFHVCSPNNGQ